MALAAFPLNTNAQTRLADIEFNTARLAKQEGTENAEAEWNKATLSARAALRASPINPQALRALAMTTDDQERREALLLASNRQSRRDAMTQLLLAEVFARADEPERALVHYDTLLRRDTGLRDAAGRGLALGVASPDLQPMVARLLETSPPWESLVYYYLVREKQSFDGFIEIHRLLRNKGVIPANVSAEFSNALLLSGRISDAVSIAKMSGQPALETSNQLIDNRFLVDPPFPGVWTVNPEIAATLRPLRGGGALIAVSQGDSGLLAARLVALQPGNYQTALTINEAGTRGGEDATLSAKLNCGPNPDPAIAASKLSIGADCSYAWLSIILAEPISQVADFDVSKIEVMRDE